MKTMIDRKKILIPFLLLQTVFLSLPRDLCAQNSDDPSSYVSVSLDRFSELAWENSLRAQLYRNSMDSANLSLRANYRIARLPQMTLTSSDQRALDATTSNANAGLALDTATFAAPPVANTYTNTLNQSLTVNSPVYPTGGTLGLTMAQNRSVIESAGATASAEISPRFSASYTQPLFIFTGDLNRRNWKRTQLNYDSAVASLNHEKLAIWVDARTVYYQAVQKQSSLEVERETLKSSQAVLSVTQALVNAGRYAPVELSRAELRYAREQRRILNAQTALTQGLNELKNFVQMPSSAHVVLTTQLAYEPFTWSLPALVEFALQHRQDYANANRALDLAQLNLKDIKESNRPNISVVSTVYRGRVLNNPGTVTTYNNGWSVQGLATWLLFDSGITRLKVKQTVKDNDNARIAAENIRHQIQVDVENAFLNVKGLETQLRDFDASRKQALNNVKAVRYRYANGLDRLIDVFDAENDMRDLELEYLGVLISYHSAKDQLALTLDGQLEVVPK